jgi:hypothetical protein
VQHKAKVVGFALEALSDVSLRRSFLPKAKPGRPLISIRSKARHGL